MSLITLKILSRSESGHTYKSNCSWTLQRVKVELKTCQRKMAKSLMVIECKDLDKITMISEI